MKKETFRQLAMQAIEACMGLPDDLWVTGCPVIRLHVKGTDETVVVGIETPDEASDED